MINIEEYVYLGSASATSGGGGADINNQDKTITINGTYTADAGYTGLGTVTVNVPNPSTGELSITENGTYNVTNYASASVLVEPTLITKTITENGVYSAQDDSADGYSQVTVNVSSTPVDHGGAYHILVVDYDGTILKEDHLNTGEVFTMPNAPTHDKLVFAEWSSSQALVNNTIVVADNDVIAGAIYDTVSGKNEFDVSVDSVAGMTAYLPMNGTKDWGDGTTDTTTSHTYTTAGNYTITCDGTKITGTICGSGTYAPDNFIYTHIRLTNITQFANNCFYQLRNLESINLAKNSPETKTSMFCWCPRLKCCVFPNGFTNVSSSMFKEDYALEYVVPSYNVAKISGSSLQNCQSLKSLILPKGVTFSTASNAFQYTYGLREITWTADTIIQGPTYDTPENLKRLVCTSNVASITSNRILGTGVYNLDVIDFSHAATVPTLSGPLFDNYNKHMKIKVPTALYDQWIVASNWATYADNIVAV